MSIKNIHLMKEPKEDWINKRDKIKTTHLERQNSDPINRANSDPKMIAGM